MATIVTYARVSTVRQGHSGLGLEAQQQALSSFAASGGHRVVAAFVEVESGKHADRPELRAALAACRLHRATLCIAKLDRLSRSMLFIAGVMDSGVDFVACDMPAASRISLHIMAAMAEYERDMISQRTKAALAAAKARGVRLGNPNGAAALLAGCREASAKGGAATRRRADEHAAQVLPLLRRLQADGCDGASALARALNNKGVPTPSGGAVWHAEQVRRVIRRAGEVAAAA